MPDGLTTTNIINQLEGVLGMDGTRDVLAHVSLNGIGPVHNGAKTVVEALLKVTDTLMMPAFTYQTQIVPQAGPPNNAINYGEGDEMNTRAAFFRPAMPVHPDCGSVAEELRQHPGTLRSVHPILSFVANGTNAEEILKSQSRDHPLGPIASLEARGGAVLLVGLDQRHNYALHLAEQRAGRKTFTRWALTLDDIAELHHIPGCMEGFNDIWRDLMEYAQVTELGLARVELIDLRGMLAYAEQRLRDEPNFMLCGKPTCTSCRAREVL